jgi:16S rRNA processing protein RimM
VPDQRYILIGRIVGVHGMRGNLKLRSYAQSWELFAADRLIIAVCADGRETVYTINGAKPQGRTILLSLKGVTSRSQAHSLAGCDVFIDKKMLPELEEDTYYWFDLIGVDVYSVEGEYIGRLESIFETGSNDVYVVTHKGKERLIPALKSVVMAVDLQARRIQVNLPEGLD